MKRMKNAHIYIISICICVYIYIYVCVCMCVYRLFKACTLVGRCLTLTELLGDLTSRAVGAQATLQVSLLPKRCPPSVYLAVCGGGLGFIRNSFSSTDLMIDVLWGALNYILCRRLGCSNHSQLVIVRCNNSYNCCIIYNLSISLLLSLLASYHQVKIIVIVIKSKVLSCFVSA
jgi:hypothetical protein